MNIRIVPHRVPMCDNATWWKVQTKVTWLKIGRFRLWRWKTIGDYCLFSTAKVVAKTVFEEQMIEKEW